MNSPTHTFRCGACGTTVSNIPSYTDHTLLKVMTTHAALCPGTPPTSTTSDSPQAVAPKDSDPPPSQP